LTATDIVDETILQAWDCFRTTQVGGERLHTWLREIMERVVAEAIVQISTEEDAPREGALAGVQPERTIAYDRDDGEEETPRAFFDADDDLLIWEDLFPEEKLPEPLEKLIEDEQRQAIIEAFGTVPITDRIAFTLNVLDGYDPAEISRIQRRAKEDVSRSLERAREVLRKALSRVQSEGEKNGGTDGAEGGGSD
jgi:RNA polymerase sigma factor (sigma-70 family)